MNDVKVVGSEYRIGDSVEFRAPWAGFWVPAEVTGIEEHEDDQGPYLMIWVTLYNLLTYRLIGPQIAMQVRMTRAE
jgi:hypothetical protein